MKFHSVCLLFWAILLSVCVGFHAHAAAGAASISGDATVQPEYPTVSPAYSPTPHGSARHINGTTVILTIMADDTTSAWNNDWNTLEKTRRNLVSATNWISRQCAAYGSNTRFLCDWAQRCDLLYSATFPMQLVREDGSMYQTQRDWLDTYFPVDEVKWKYGADNVIYLFLFNTPYSNTVNPWTVHWTEDYPSDYEIINNFVRFDNVDTPASSLAHEILHCFGAPDLYYSNRLIPQDYVNHCGYSHSQDIMYTVNAGETITVAFTQLCAYYVGLAGRPYEANQWGLGCSEFD